MIPFSILDLSPVAMGSNPAQSLRNTLDLAQHAEQWGYHRYWLAEHHSMPGIASAATSVVICHVASGTSSIRVGAGGIMLPNHSPLVIAEQFGTLESLFPGRIDLGLGPRSGFRSADGAGLAAQSRLGPRALSPRRARVDGIFRAAHRGAAGHGHPRRRTQGAAVDPGFKPVRRTGRGRVGSALRLRVALRAGHDDAGLGSLPRAIPTVRTARSPLCDAGIQYLRCRVRCRSAPAGHLDATGVRESAQRPADAVAAAAAGVRGAAAAGRQGDAGRCAHLFRGGRARHGSARAAGLHRSAPGPTS